MKKSQLTLWRPLILCTTATVVYSFAIHLEFFLCVFDPVFHNDSPSYFLGAVQWLSGRPFHVPVERTYGYPLFLLLTLQAFGSFSAAVFIQHGMALASGAIAGLICFRYLRSGPLAALAAAFFSATMPPMVVMAHAILSETLYGFLLLGSLLFFFKAISHRHWPYWLMTGIMTAGALIVRPVGWSLVGALVLGSLMAGRRLNSWRGPLYGLLSFLGILISVCAISAVQRGFFGLDQFTGFSLIGTTARYVELEKLKDAKLQELLKPVYARTGRAERLLDPIWVRYDPEGPVSRLRSAFDDSAAMDKILTQISLQAIANHPFLFAKDQVRLAFDVLWRRNGVPGLYQDLTFSFFVYRGALIYKDAAGMLFAGRRLEPIGTSVAPSFLKAMSQLQHLPEVQAEKFLDELRSSDFYQCKNTFGLLRVFQPVVDKLQWLPLLALLAGGFLAMAGTARWELSVLFILMTFHMLLSNLGGDGDRRHLVPIEPLMWSVLWTGFSAGLSRLRASFVK